MFRGDTFIWVGLKRPSYIQELTIKFCSIYLTFSVEQGCSYKSQLWLISLAERETWGNPEYAVKQEKNAL